MIDSLVHNAAFPWIVGASIGVVVVILIGGYIRKYDIKFGKVRPQILVVLFALSLIALAGLVVGQSEVSAGAAAGMIALATRIIEQDSAPGSE